MNETETLAKQLMLQAYALPESKLRELMDALEVEYVNRLAEQAGYLSSEECCFV
jgi:hypothetical protein